MRASRRESPRTHTLFWATTATTRKTAGTGASLGARRSRGGRAWSTGRGMATGTGSASIASDVPCEGCATRRLPAVQRRGRQGGTGRYLYSVKAYAQDSQRCQARRSAHRAAHQVRAGHQPHDCQGVGAHDPAVGPSSGGSGHRVMRSRDFLPLEGRERQGPPVKPTRWLPGCLLIGLVCVGSPQIASACLGAPSRQTVPYPELIGRTANIVLARAERAELLPDQRVRYLFRTVEVLKGKPRRTFTLTFNSWIYRLGEFDTDFDKHRDGRFWDRRASRQWNAPDCKMALNFVI